MVRWDDFLVPPIEPRSVEQEPVPDARFFDLEEPLNDSRIMRTHEKDFVDWCYQTVEVNVKANEKLNVYAGPEISESDFEKMCAAAIEKELKEDIEKFLKKHEGQIERIEEKLKREKRELKEDEAEHSMRKSEEGLSHVETLVGLFGGRRRSLSASMSKRRMTKRAKADVEESIEAIDEFEEELEELEEEKKESLEDLKYQWQEISGEIIDIPVKPYKKDIRVELFGVAWVPYHQVEGDDGSFELPGFAQKS
jgi:DNA repair exonuclease SbcCD ATPase subunit